MARLSRSTWYVGLTTLAVLRGWEGHRNTASTRTEQLTMVVIHRSMRDVPLKSRTSAFGSATIRVRALTICTRNIARCQGRKRLMRFTKIWQQGTEPVSDRSTYVTRRPMRPRGEHANDRADPQSCRARGYRRRQASLHQATSQQEPQIPTPTSCR